MNRRALGKIGVMLTATVMVMTTVTAEISFKDAALFPPELYPQINYKTQDEVTLAGLSALYPAKVTRTPPVTAAPNFSRKPLTAPLPNGITYIRCYAPNADAVTFPEDTRGVIVDLRHFASPPETVTECVSFCQKIFGETPSVTTRGDYPVPAVTRENFSEKTASPRVVVLVNKGTAGPIEPMLAELQARKKIILVGTVTAGITARHRQIGTTGWWSVTGEICANDGSQPAPSLVGIGVTPKVKVTVAPEDDLIAWHWIEHGESPLTLLRHSQANERAAANRTKTSAPNGEKQTVTTRDTTRTDLILQRGHEILAALHTMENVAPSTQ